MINLEQIPEDKPCEWQDGDGYCWLEMPDSKLKCKGKCDYYKFTGDYVGKTL